MAERKSGPVKPPVIEGTARAAADKKPDITTPIAGAKAAEAKSEAVANKPSAPAEAPKAKPAESTTIPPKPAQSQEIPKTTIDSPLRAKPAPSLWPAAIAGGASGAVLGLALAYGIASAGLWPAAQSSVDATHLQRLEQTLAATDKTAQTAISDIAAVSARMDATQSNVGGMSSALDELKTAGAPDLSGIEANLKTLSDRIDAIGAGASSADAGALAENLTSVKTSLAEVTAKVATLTQDTAQANSTVQTLTSDVETIKTALAAEAQKPSPEAIMGPALRLPMVLSGLENAISSGRPFAPELAALKQILPETAIPDPVTSAATTGLSDPRTITERFNTALPDILAARPTNPAGSWNDTALDWLKNVLVLRPSGNVPGDTPDAVLARLETAISAGDFSTAATLFASLPEPMKQAAGTLPQDVANLADANAFITTLRTSALADKGVAQ
jgi:hypothetical protein